MKPLTHPFGEEELDPIEIDPRPCELCGYTIDQHRRVDTPEGPEFFCDDLDTLLHLRAADLVKQWELADPRDAWRHTGELPPPLEVRNSQHIVQDRPYRTAQSVVDAFKYVVSLNGADHLERWLADHPADAAELFKIWKGK